MSRKYIYLHTLDSPKVAHEKPMQAIEYALKAAEWSGDGSKELPESAELLHLLNAKGHVAINFKENRTNKNKTIRIDRINKL